MCQSGVWAEANAGEPLSMALGRRGAARKLSKRPTVQQSGLRLEDLTVDPGNVVPTQNLLAAVTNGRVATTHAGEKGIVYTVRGRRAPQCVQHLLFTRDLIQRRVACRIQASIHAWPACSIAAIVGDVHLEMLAAGRFEHP